MKNKKITILLCSVVALFLIGSIINADSNVPKDKIKGMFDEIKVAMSQDEQNTHEVLVKGNDFEISKKSFVFYKKNLEMINSLHNSNVVVNDNELINTMIKTQLVVEYAKEAGLNVSEDELKAVIEREKSALNDTTITGEINETVREIMKNRIRITGLSDNEFWGSKDVSKTYTDAILNGKVFEYLAAQNKIKTQEDFQSFQNDLLKSSKGEYTINTDLIK